MGFTTFVHDTSHQTYPVAICDGCSKVVGLDGQIVQGARLEDDTSPTMTLAEAGIAAEWERYLAGEDNIAMHDNEQLLQPFTSIGPDYGMPPVTVGLACSRECHLYLLSHWELPDRNGKTVPYGPQAGFYDQPQIVGLGLEVEEISVDDYLRALVQSMVGGSLKEMHADREPVGACSRAG